MAYVLVNGGLVWDPPPPTPHGGGGGSMTAAEILAELLSVDGADSGLVADYLDGFDSANFVGNTEFSEHQNDVNVALGALSDADVALDAGIANANTDIGTLLGRLDKFVVIAESMYDALDPPDATTFYFVVP